MEGVEGGRIGRGHSLASSMGPRPRGSVGGEYVCRRGERKEVGICAVSWPPRPPCPPAPCPGSGRYSCLAVAPSPSQLDPQPGGPMRSLALSRYAPQAPGSTLSPRPQAQGRHPPHTPVCHYSQREVGREVEAGAVEGQGAAVGQVQPGGGRGAGEAAGNEWGHWRHRHRGWGSGAALPGAGAAHKAPALPSPTSRHTCPCYDILRHDIPDMPPS